jgi:hypothetical protein
MRPTQLWSPHGTSEEEGLVAFAASLFAGILVLILAKLVTVEAS